MIALYKKATQFVGFAVALFSTELLYAWTGGSYLDWRYTFLGNGNLKYHILGNTLFGFVAVYTYGASSYIFGQDIYIANLPKEYIKIGCITYDGFYYCSFISYKYRLLLSIVLMVNSLVASEVRNMILKRLNNDIPKVSVCVVTYNHEKYIRESIVTQKCDSRRGLFY